MENSSYFVSSKRLVLTSRVSESEAMSQYLKKNRAERSVKGYVSPLAPAVYGIRYPIA